MVIARLTAQDATGTASAASVAATYPSTPTQFNLLVARVYANVGTGNTTISGWAIPTGGEGACGANAANGAVTIMFKVAGAGESTTVTANATGATFMRIQIAEYSGAATSSLTDGTSTPANSGSTAVASQIATTVGHTTSNADDLVVSVFGFSGNITTPTIDSSFTLLPGALGRLFSADRIVAATGTYNPTISWTSGVMRAGGAMAAFKAAATGTSVSGADTGTGVDAATLAASLTATDTGTGTDAATLAASVTATDTGTGTDAGALTAALTGADTGTAANAATLTATLTAGDTGHAVDAASVTVQVAGADVATAVDQAAVTAAVTAGDTGHAVDAATVATATVRDITATAGPTARSWTATTTTTPRPSAAATPRWKATR